MTLRVFAGGIATETNVFSPMPTGLRDFTVVQASDASQARSRILGGSAFSRFAEAAQTHGCDYVQGSYAWAQPAGRVPRPAYEDLRDSFLAELRAAMPIDCLLLNLHGAMVADGYDDCESDLVARARSLVGTRAKIGVLLDLHCDLPESLLDPADVIITFKEYPHVDIEQRAAEVATLTLQAAHGEIHPTMALRDCGMVGLYPTPPRPMSEFVAGMEEVETRSGILSVSLVHGFPWGDAPDLGAQTLVVTDGNPDLAETTAAELAQRFFQLRHEVSLRPLPMRTALDRALGKRRGRRPVVVADVADNSGGGAASDSTFVLRDLLDRHVENAAIALIWDPIVVEQAFAAGVGANLHIRLGGKMGPASGEPLDMPVDVRGLAPNLLQRWPQSAGYIEISCGDCAHLRCAGIDVIVSTIRQQVLGTEVLTAFDIEPQDRDLIVVKSTNHFHAAFAPVADDVIYMSAPGALTFDFQSLPYRHFKGGKYPWDDSQGLRRVQSGDRV